MASGKGPVIPISLKEQLHKLLRVVLLNRPVELHSFFAEYLEAELDRRTLDDLQLGRTTIGRDVGDSATGRDAEISRTDEASAVVTRRASKKKESTSKVTDNQTRQKRPPNVTKTPASNVSVEKGAKQMPVTSVPQKGDSKTPSPKRKSMEDQDRKSKKAVPKRKSKEESSKSDKDATYFEDYFLSLRSDGPIFVPELDAREGPSVEGNESETTFWNQLDQPEVGATEPFVPLCSVSNVEVASGRLPAVDKGESVEVSGKKGGSGSDKGPPFSHGSEVEGSPWAGKGEDIPIFQGFDGPEPPMFEGVDVDEKQDLGQEETNEEFLKGQEQEDTEDYSQPPVEGEDSGEETEGTDEEIAGAGKEVKATDEAVAEYTVFHEDYSSTDEEVAAGRRITESTVAEIGEIVKVIRALSEEGIKSPNDEPRTAPEETTTADGEVVQEPSKVDHEPSTVVQEPSKVVEKPSKVVKKPSKVAQKPSKVVQGPSEVPEGPLPDSSGQSSSSELAQTVKSPDVTEEPEKDQDSDKLKDFAAEIATAEVDRGKVEGKKKGGREKGKSDGTKVEGQDQPGFLITKPSTDEEKEEGKKEGDDDKKAEELNIPGGGEEENEKGKDSKKQKDGKKSSGKAGHSSKQKEGQLASSSTDKSKKRKESVSRNEPSFVRILPNDNEASITTFHPASSFFMSDESFPFDHTASAHKDPSATPLSPLPTSPTPAAPTEPQPPSDAPAPTIQPSKSSGISPKASTVEDTTEAGQLISIDGLLEQVRVIENTMEGPPPPRSLEV